MVAIQEITITMTVDAVVQKQIAQEALVQKQQQLTNYRELNIIVGCPNKGHPFFGT